MVKLIASDMDGTLLDQKGNIPLEFYTAFKKLKKNNIHFAVASGRQLYTLIDNFKELKDDIIYIAENGTYVVYENEELYTCTVDTEIIHELIEVSRKIDGTGIVLCGKKAAYVESSDSRLKNEVKKYYKSNKVVDDLMKVEDEFLKFTLYDYKGAAENANKILYPIYKDKLGVLVSGEHWLDIINKNANKGEALKHIQKKLNISFEETMAFGDYFNDVEMLQNAGHSYAMANAPAEVKKHARFVAKGNSENGVIAVIKDMLGIY